METGDIFFQTQQEQESSNKFINDVSLNDNVQLLTAAL